MQFFPHVIYKAGEEVTFDFYHYDQDCSVPALRNTI